MGKITGSRLNSKYTIEKKFTDGSNCYVSVRLNHIKDKLVSKNEDLEVHEHISQYGDVIHYEVLCHRIYQNLVIVN